MYYIISVLTELRFPSNLELDKIKNKMFIKLSTRLCIFPLKPADNHEQVNIPFYIDKVRITLIL